MYITSGTLPIGLERTKSGILPGWLISLLRKGANSFNRKVSFLSTVHVPGKMAVQRGLMTLLVGLSSTRRVFSTLGYHP